MTLPTPVAAWSFDFIDGSDATGNGHTATVFSFGTGHSDVGAVGDASNSAFVYEGELGLGEDNPELTVMCWANPVTFSGTPDIITLLDSSESTYCGAYWTDSSNIKLYIQDNAGYHESSGVALAKGTWTHLAVVVNASGATLYMNGTPVASVTRSGTAMGDLNGLFLGGHGGKAGGAYDDVRVFDLAVSQADINTFKDLSVGTEPTPTVPEIATVTLHAVYAGRAFDQTLGATNDPTGWAVTSGSLPTGLALNPTTGRITGTPYDTSGTPFSFAVTASNAEGDSDPVTYSGTITTLPPVLLSWAADEGTGTQAVDYSGNGHYGTTQADGWVAGRAPHAFAAQGNSTNPAIKLEDEVIFSGSKTATLMCWAKAVNWTGPSGDLIEVKSTHDAHTALTLYRPTTAALQSEYHDSNGHLTDTTSVPATLTGEWHHVCCTLSETELRVYLDGVLVANQAVTGTGDLGDIQLLYAGGTDTKPQQAAVNDIRFLAVPVTVNDVAYFMDTPVVAATDYAGAGADAVALSDQAAAVLARSATDATALATDSLGGTDEVELDLETAPAGGLETNNAEPLADAVAVALDRGRAPADPQQLFDHAKAVLTGPGHAQVTAHWWNGTDELAGSVSLWDGTREVQLTVEPAE